MWELLACARKSPRQVVEESKEASKEEVIPMLQGATSKKADLGKELTNELEIDGSIYQDAVFCPLVRGINEKGQWKASCGIYGKMVWLLIVNVVLQVSMAIKMWDVTKTTKGDFVESVFDMCTETFPAGLPWFTNMSLKEGQRYYDCTPITVSVAASNITYLDRNGDGLWSQSDAFQLEDELNDLGQGERVASFGNMLYNTNDFLKIVPNNKSIEVSWLENQSQKIKLCALQDALLCSNVEVDYRLRSAIPIRGAAPRVRKCRTLFAENRLCGIFGARLEFYSKNRKKICGDPSFSWSDEKNVNEVTYSATSTWYTNADSVHSLTFNSFLFFILVVWFMLMFGEFNYLIRWLSVLTLIEAKDGERYQRDGDQKYKFESIPFFHRAFCLGAVLLPRLLIFFIVGYVGTVFLTASGDYVELLLNATALGFLLEIDQMLHQACADDRTRQCVEMCYPIKVDSRNRFLALYQKGFTYISSTLLMVVSAAVVYNTFRTNHGNSEISKALLCLCHVDGEHCLGAALLQELKQDMS